MSESLESTGVKALLRSAPDLSGMIEHIRGMYTIEQNGKHRLLDLVLDQL